MTYEQHVTVTKVLVLLVTALTERYPEYGWQMQGSKPVFRPVRAARERQEA